MAIVRPLLSKNSVRLFCGAYCKRCTAYEPSENGGVYTCVDRNGELMDTTKSVWFQGRFAYTCCFAYNNIEHRQEWLDAAKQTIDFIEAHCFDTDRHMFFEVTADGKPLRKRRYVFSESFAAIAMAEYSKATGDRTYAEKAMQIFREMRKRLTTPGLLIGRAHV